MSLGQAFTPGVEGLRTIDAVLTAAAMQADRVSLLAAREASTWLADVIRSAAEQVTTLDRTQIGTQLAARDVLRFLTDLQALLTGKRVPRPVQEAIQTARSVVTQIADTSATQALELSVPGYRKPDVSLPPIAAERLAPFVAADAAGVFRAIARDDQQLAHYLSTRITAAQIAGLGPRDLTRRIAAELGTLSTYRIDAVVRTEMLRGMTARQLAHYRASPAVAGWRWSSTLDRRTCAVCWALHGQIFPLDAAMHRHPRCRCVPQPVTEFALADPTTREALRESTGWAQMKRMSQEELARILGPTRAEILRKENWFAFDSSWRGLVKLSTYRGWKTPVIPTVRAFKRGIASQFEAEHDVPPEVLRTAAALAKGVSPQEKAVARALAAYLKARPEGQPIPYEPDDPRAVIEPLIKRGQLLDQALRAASPEYADVMRRAEPAVQRLRTAQLEALAGENPGAFEDLFRQTAFDLERIPPDVVEKAGKAILDLVNKVSPAGGDIPTVELRYAPDEWTPELEVASRAGVAQALTVYPKRWKALLMARPFTVGVSFRGSYNASSNHLTLPPFTVVPLVTTTAAHEFGHAAQAMIRTMRIAEDLLIQYRLSTLPKAARQPQQLNTVMPRTGYRDDETFYPGVFADPYMAKVYAAKHTEVLSMLMQALSELQRGSRHGLIVLGDPDVRAWFLTVLLELGHETPLSRLPFA